jgi:hypothetical protein
MDRNDPDTFVSLFTDDGVIEVIKTKKIYDTPLLIKGLCSEIYTKFTPALHFVSLLACLLFLTFLTWDRNQTSSSTSTQTLSEPPINLIGGVSLEVK